MDTADRTPFLEPWRAAHRRNLVLVGLFHMLRSIPLFGSTAWWAFYAERERGGQGVDGGHAATPRSSAMILAT